MNKIEGIKSICKRPHLVQKGGMSITEIALALGITYQENLEHLSMNLEMEYLDFTPLDELYKDAVIYYTKNNSFNLDDFLNQIDDSKKSILILLKYHYF